MNDEEIQFMIDYWNWKYEEVCRNRVGVTAPCTAIVLILIIGIIIISILTCVFG